MKLSPESEAVVKATAGVVAEHAEQITKVFYPDMFAAHPELTRTFNMANQAVGEQPKALAASVVAYALSLIDPDAPDFTPVMQRIAHKHVSLGIQAQEYTIVGHHLLKAVGAVLGDAVTPEVASAWDEVYWLFGTMLIAEEAKLYALGGTDPDHPWRKYTIVERVEETADVFSLALKPVEGELPEHRTGQYVALGVDLPGGKRQPRQYTISNGAGQDVFQVTIRCVHGVDGVPDGQVSTWLYENARVGMELDVSQPAGDVVLDDSDSPLVLISAGIGVTPMAAVLEDVTVRQPRRQVLVLHADQAHETQALYASMRKRIEFLENATSQVWYERDAESAPTIRPARAGYMMLDDIDVPTEAKVFMCGPLEFMRGVRKSLLDKGVHPENIGYEVFGPDLWAQNPEAANV